MNRPVHFGPTSAIQVRALQTGQAAESIDERVSTFGAARVDSIGLGIAIAAIGFLGAGISTAHGARRACTGGGKISQADREADGRRAGRAEGQALAGSSDEDAGGRGECPAPRPQSDQYWMAEFRGYAYHAAQSIRRRGAGARIRTQLALHAGIREARALQEPRRPLFRAAELPEGHRVTRTAPSRFARDPEMQVTLAQAYYLSGNNKEAVRVMNEMHGQHRSSAARCRRNSSCCWSARPATRRGDNACVTKRVRKARRPLPEARVLAEPHGGAQQGRHRRHAEAQRHAPGVSSECA